MAAREIYDRAWSTRASGKTHTVPFRHATNRRARQALHTWLDNSRAHYPPPTAEPVYLPRELEQVRRRQHLADGITLNTPVIGDVNEFAQQYRLQPPWLTSHLDTSTSEATDN
jgi:LDH2 family malate/lactate/ureidoglycolate dehydrogenase